MMRIIWFSGAWLVRGCDGSVGFVSCRHVVVESYNVSQQEIDAIVAKTMHEVGQRLEVA